LKLLIVELHNRCRVKNQNKRECNCKRSHNKSRCCPKNEGVNVTIYTGMLDKPQGKKKMKPESSNPSPIPSLIQIAVISSSELLL